MLRPAEEMLAGPIGRGRARVTRRGKLKLNGFQAISGFAPREGNIGSPFAGHTFLYWVRHGHSYLLGFHNSRDDGSDVHANQLNLAVAKSIVYESPIR